MSMKTFLSLMVTLSALGCAPLVSNAQTAIMGLQPPSLTIKQGRKDGVFLTSGIFVTRHNNSLKSRFNLLFSNIKPGTLFRAIAVNDDTLDEIVLAQQIMKKKKGAAKIKSNGLQPLPDGQYTIQLSRTEPGKAEARTKMFTMLVDTSPPGPAPAPDLPFSFDTGLQGGDNLTRLRTVNLNGSAEPNSIIVAAIDGRVKIGRKAQVAIADSSGAYTLTIPKIKPGTHKYAVVQIDAANNRSAIGAPLAITLDTKPPSRVKNIVAQKSDIRELRKKLVVVSTRVPLIVAKGEPGLRFVMSVDGQPILQGRIATSGVLTGRIPSRRNSEGTFGLLDGLHTVTATQTDLAGNVSRPAKPLAIFVEPGTPGGDPGQDIVLTDQFDGARSPAFQWISGTRESSILSVTENALTQQLEFGFSEIQGDRASAAFMSKNWGFDLTKGFKFRADWTFSSKLQVFGSQGLVIGIASDAERTNGEAYEGVFARIARDDSGDVVQFQRLEDGDPDADDQFSTTRQVDIGAVYFNYDATTDTLRLSIVGFDDTNAFVINNLRSKLGTSKAAILLGAETDGFTPAVPAANAVIDNLVIEEGLLTTFTPISSGAGLIPSKYDNFNDNSLSSAWLAFPLNTTFTKSTETNSRLEFNIAQNTQTGADSTRMGGITGSDWAIDLMRDFRMRIDFHFKAPETMFGDVRLGVGLAQGFNPALVAPKIIDPATGNTIDGPAPTAGDIIDGVEYVFGQDSTGATFGVISRKNSADTLTDLLIPLVQRGTIYITYSAASNKLDFSLEGFSDDLAPFSVSNFRTATLTSARLVLFAESRMSSPAVAGPNAFFDNFSLDVGALTTPPPPPPPPTPMIPSGGPGGASAPLSAGPFSQAPACLFDLNRDGAVDSTDLQLLLSRNNPAPTDGEVRALLNSMGPCPR